MRKKMTYKTLTVRISKNMLKEVDKLSSEAEVEKSVALREILSIGLKQKKIQNAIARYKTGKISFGRAVELSGIDYRAFVEELRKRGEITRYSKDKLLKEVSSL